MKRLKSIVVYFSAAGTTRIVAEMITEMITKEGHDAQLFDVSRQFEETIAAVRQLKQGDCLWVGSPIYAGHVIPPVEAFLSGLPVSHGVFAVPFISFGAISSGTGLYEMAALLAEKEYPVLGGAKIVAQHALMWQCDEPLGKDHPGPEDEKQLSQLVGSVLDKLQLGNSAGAIVPETLNYQALDVQEIGKEFTLELLKEHMPPIVLDEDTCTSCGVCRENCPMQNIVLDTSLIFGDNCVLCFNCIRVCEPGALTNESLDDMEVLIRERAELYDEPAETQIFV